MLGKRFRLQAVDRRNRPTPVYMSMEVKGKLHLTVGSGTDQIDLYLRAADLRDALIELATGRKTISGKHVAAAEVKSHG